MKAVFCTIKYMTRDFNWNTCIISGKFCHYNYGPSENLLRYHSKTPPDYDLSKVTAPTFVIHSKKDTLVPPVVMMCLHLFYVYSL